MTYLKRGCIALAVAVATISALPLASAAQEAKVEVRDADTLKTVLERQLNNRVTLALGTGPELTGKVAKVGSSVVHLSEIQGREFFDAVVALDRISAVLVRVRGR